MLKLDLLLKPAIKEKTPLVFLIHHATAGKRIVAKAYDSNNHHEADKWKACCYMSIPVFNKCM